MYPARAATVDDLPLEQPIQVTRQELGLRIVYSFFLAIALQVVSAALSLVVLLAIVLAFATRELPPLRLRRFGEALCRYALAILRYVTFLDRKPPFPFSDWPTAETSERA